MQEELGARKQSSRCSGVQPLADLQQNVLSGQSRPIHSSSSSGTTKRSNLSVEDQTQTPSVRQVQKWLKALGLSQYAAAFAREEIDEDALVCLTSHDLRSIGISNIAHQRLILSAALQTSKPAVITVTDSVTAPASKVSGVSTAHAAKSLAHVNVKAAPDCAAAAIHPSAMPKVAAAKSAAEPLALPNARTSGTSDSQASASNVAHTSGRATAVAATPAVQSPAATLPIKPLPGGGLHSIANTVALRQVKVASAVSAKPQPAPASAQHAHAAANPAALGQMAKITATAVSASPQPAPASAQHANAAAKSQHRQLQPKPAKSSKTDAATSKATGIGSRVGCDASNSAASNSDASADKDADAGTRHASSTGGKQSANQPAAVAAARNAGSTAEPRRSASSASAGHASSGVRTGEIQSAHPAAAVTAARNAGSTAEPRRSASSAAAGSSGRHSIAPAPSSRHDEARQLAMALSASLGQPTDDSPIPSQAAMPSCAASQGVFMTMMAASRHKAHTTAQTDAAAVNSTDPTCSREQEEALLNRLFSNCTASTSCTGSNVLGATGSQGLRQTQAKQVNTVDAVWTSAGLSEPPDCHLPQRVQKRKAEADLQRQKAKQQALEQQRLAADAAPTRNHDAAAKEQKSGNAKEGSTADLSAVAHGSECIVLDSPLRAASQKKTMAGCSQGHYSESQTSQTMDPMKRMRLQALQQELVAAKQTVLDLERMIRHEQLS